jgi:hypothetical protein
LVDLDHQKANQLNHVDEEAHDLDVDPGTALRE